MTDAPRQRRYNVVKRILDVAAAVAGLVLLSPAIIVVGSVVAVKLGRPVIFQQDRPGRNGKVFRLYKFRSMKSVDHALGLVTDEQRLTAFGLALRSTSLDELPTLVNVLKGDMSIIGPRPLLVRYLGRYTPEQSRRHDVRPGITGLAQATGRNSLSWEEKFARDVEYVDTHSFFLDATILAKTLLSVARRDGISAEGHVTASEFMGVPGQKVDK